MIEKAKLSSHFEVIPLTLQTLFQFAIQKMMKKYISIDSTREMFMLQELVRFSGHLRVKMWS